MTATAMEQQRQRDIVPNHTLFVSYVYDKLNKETDKLGYYNHYSKTKQNAEKKLLKNLKKNLIIRTNFTGFKKNSLNFLSWLHKSIKKKKH